jgi:hypothetical protein
MAIFLKDGSQIKIEFVLAVRPELVEGYERKNIFLGSSVVEQTTVNRWVAGSNPARGATVLEW